ncbi:MULTISPECIES: hypothetical protein [unclassified Paenibacillus]|uniref:hypothetical protein n=1 Tax=unclassified Paenibacillus TaxID=185978 RepID=UPI001C11E0D2|nr:MULTISPECIES: hypothetical protein [unclassified Paenibacillus]MBU5441049.1 hypothetical protein [Paenibacillus sp. MSJ-34]CAH0117961.1 hypothetical protein PAE9249_00426 [Paenibacillus sp. CECT 9249]
MGQPSKHNIRSALERELADAEFTDIMKRRVLQRAKPSFWEREIRIPGSAAAAVCLLVIAGGWLWLDCADSSSSYLKQMQAVIEEERRDIGTVERYESELIAMNGGVYYKEQLQKGWER